MENQKIRVLTQIIALSFLFCGITTMNYAENFNIKYSYTDVVKTINPPMSISYNTIAISNDNSIVIDHLSDVFSIKSDEFGIYKTPLSEEMKVKMQEINKLLRVSNIEKILATDNEKRDFIYVLDNDNVQFRKQKIIKGLEIVENWDKNQFLKYGNPKQAQSSQKISQFYIDLVKNFHSQPKVKVADFYGTTNIIPKKEGLEVILTLKNVGPFDVTLSNPKSWEAIPKVGEEVNTDKTWYEIVFGGLYKDVSWTTRFGLENKYLIKDELQSDQALYGSFIVKSNSERTLRFLVPYQDIQFRSNTGLIDGNRTKEGYILLDYHAGVLDSSWIMYIDFGGIFSQRVWKAEKTSTVKGWINLE